MTVEQRLDRVEDDLEIAKQLLASAARYAESANEGLERLTVRIDRMSEKVDELTASQSRSDARLDRLSQKVDQLAESEARTQARFDQLAQRIVLLSDRLLGGVQSNRDFRHPSNRRSLFGCANGI